MKFILIILFLPLLSQANALRATYEVPTSHTDLIAASLFELPDFAVSRDADKTTIYYKLPLELTGLENAVALSAPSDQLDCVTSQTEMMCSVKYSSLNIDNELAQQRLAEKFTGLELQNRMQVQSRFVQDPIGIIRIYFSNY